MTLKSRIEKLRKRAAEAPGVDVAAHWRRVFRERRAVFEKFLTAVPEAFAGEMTAVIEPHVERLLHPRGWPAEDAPYIPRVIFHFTYDGWFPDPLPEAWVRLALAPDSVEGFYDCEGCGLPHPSGGPYRDQDGRTRDCRPLVGACLHCGGAVKFNGFFNRHGHRACDGRLGAMLLAGKDPTRRQGPPGV